MCVRILSPVVLLASVFAFNCHAVSPREDAGQQWELFDAMKNELVEVKFIPLGTDNANVLVKNKTKLPLQVRLPEAFAGVPILGQGFGGGGGGLGGGGQGGGGGGLGGGGGGGGGGQALGGGGGGGGFGGGQGGGGGGGGGGFFRIAPDRMKKISVATVCLEHGKPNPNPRMTYTIVPLDHVTSDASVHRLCIALGNGRLSQNVAQAAAWNLMDGLAWQTLANKHRVESKYTGNVTWFTENELMQAKKLVSTLVITHSESLATTNVSTRRDTP